MGRLVHPDERYTKASTERTPLTLRVSDWGASTTVAVRRLEPPGDGTDLEVQHAGLVNGARHLVVAGGRPGARYRVTVGVSAFEVNVSALPVLPVQDERPGEPSPHTPRWRRG